MAAGLFQLVGPVDVVLLVKAGLQLHQNRHLLAVFRGLNQRRHNGGVAGNAVQRLLDGQHVLIFGGLLDKTHHHVEALVGVVDHPVLLPDGLKNIGVAPEIRRGVHRPDGREAQGLKALYPGELGEEGQIQGPGQLVNLVFLNAQHLNEEGLDVAAAFGQQLQAHRRAPLALLNGLLHLAHKVLGLFVNLQVGVAGDAEGAGRHNVVELKQLV